MSHPPARVWLERECVPFDTPFRPAVVKRPKVRERPDGDTFDVKLDLGFDVQGVVARVRLCGESWVQSQGKIGFNAWERKGSEKDQGDEAYRRRLELCAPGDNVLVRSFKGGARGSMYRWLGLVLVRLTEVDGKLLRAAPEWLNGESAAAWYSLADVLLHEGHGREWWRGWSRGAARPTF